MARVIYTQLNQRMKCGHLQGFVLNAPMTAISSLQNRFQLVSHGLFPLMEHHMAKFAPDQLVRIPCDVQPGPFPTEFLVTVKFDEMELSGFVKSDFVQKKKGAAYVQAKVLQVTGEAVTLQFPGSFFTTANGRASVPVKWASSNLELAAA